MSDEKTAEGGGGFGVKALCDRVLELDGKATAGEWYCEAIYPNGLTILVRGSRPNCNEMLVQDAFLIREYRTSAPKIARCLKIAVEALEAVRNDDDVDDWTEANNALKAIEKETAEGGKEIGGG